jgi:hypothetical protein
MSLDLANTGPEDIQNELVGEPKKAEEDPANEAGIASGGERGDHGQGSLIG